MLSLSFWWADHEWDVQIVERQLEEIVAVRRCEDDYRLSPEETEELMRRRGEAGLHAEIRRHVSRQL